MDRLKSFWAKNKIRTWLKIWGCLVKVAFQSSYKSLFHLSSGPWGKKYDVCTFQPIAQLREAHLEAPMNQPVLHFHKYRACQHWKKRYRRKNDPLWWVNWGLGTILEALWRDKSFKLWNMVVQLLVARGKLYKMAQPPACRPRDNWW